MAGEQRGEGERAPREAIGEWHNTSDVCERDETQTIVNNARGRKKEIGFTIENRGECPVLVGTAPQEGDFSGGPDPLEIRKGKQWVFITIPRGHYLLASCKNAAGIQGCSWTISGLSM